VSIGIGPRFPKSRSQFLARGKGSVKGGEFAKAATAAGSAYAREGRVHARAAREETCIRGTWWCVKRVYVRAISAVWAVCRYIGTADVKSLKEHVTRRSIQRAFSLRSIRRLVDSQEKKNDSVLQTEVRNRLRSRERIVISRESRISHPRAARTVIFDDFRVAPSRLAHLGRGSRW